MEGVGGTSGSYALALTGYSVDIRGRGHLR